MDIHICWIHHIEKGPHFFDLWSYILEETFCFFSLNEILVRICIKGNDPKPACHKTLFHWLSLKLDPCADPEGVQGVWRADGGPLIVVFGFSLPSSTKKSTQKSCQSWTPSDKTSGSVYMAEKTCIINFTGKFI